MSVWRDDAIDNYLTPIFDIISGEVDPHFSKIEFVMWFEPGVSSFSYRIFDTKGQKIRLGPDSPVNSRDNEIRTLSIKFRDVFYGHNEKWLSAEVSVTGDGKFNMELSYDDPYKFKFK